MAGRDLSEELFGAAPEGGRDLSEELFGPPAAPPPRPEGGFVPGVQRGFLQTGSLLFDILPAMAARAVGADEYAEKQFAEAAETERKIQEKYAAAVPSYKDIKGVGDAITYLTESVGELVPSILPSLVTGGIAGIAGRGAVIAAKEAAEAAARKKVAEQGAEVLAKKEVQDEIRQAGIDAARRTAIKYDAVGIVGGSSLQNIPEVYKNIKDETEQESLGTAILFGGFNSLLDAALPLSILTKLRKAGIPEEQAVGAWVKRFGTGFVKNYATESATEAAQEMSSAAAEKFVDENQEFFSEKNLERFLNAGLKGGLGGGVVGGTLDVVLGKKSLTPELKDLGEDIRNTQSDILARKAFLDELRAQADEEGRNRLNDEALKDLGLRKGPLYDSLLDKDINNPVQAEQVKLALAQAIQDPTTKPRERLAANDALNLIGEYQSTREAEPDVGQVVETAGGEGVPVPVQPAEVGAAAPGIAGVERTGVVPPVADVAEVARGEGLPPAPVEAPVEAPVPEVTPAPVSPAPAPEVAVQPAPAPAEAVVPTTRELIAEQETAIAKQMEKFQGLLQEQVKRYGLKDVGVKVIDDLKNANGMYSKGLIQLAVDTADPVRALKHESVHALKELGFFTPAQWQSLVKQANTTWVNTYMRNRDVDGNYLQPGQRSRYDAYIDLFKQQGLDDAAIQESLVEEAIADAFGDFAVAKEKPGMIRALINRMKNFFQSIKESIGLAEVTPERLFARVERGEVAAPAKPAEVKQEEPAKASLRSPNADKVIQKVAAKYPLTQQEIDSTSLALQTGKGGSDQFIKEKVGGVPEIVSFLERRRLESGLPVLDINNPDDRAKLADLLAAEALASINAGGDALEWYDETIAKTLGMAALKYPELATDPNAQMAFKLAVAISSQGMNVEDNLSFGMRQYDHFSRNKRFDEIGTGTDASAMRANYILANKLFDEYAPNNNFDDIRQFLQTPFKVEELRAAGFDIGGELGDETVLGSSVFGPKIGFGFYSNLNGNFNPVTMDMWFMRLMGRLIGKLRDFDPDLIQTQLARFRAAFDQTGEDGIYASDFKPEVLEKARTDDEAAIDLARVVNSAFNSEFSKNREMYDAGALKKTELVYAAQTILKSALAPKDAPANGTERRNLRDVTSRALDKIEQATGKRIPAASMQALVWYPEQTLYESLGAKLRVTRQDYAGAMNKLLKGEGYGQQQLDAAAQAGAGRVRGLAKKPVGRGVEPTGQEPAAPFTPERKEEFLREGEVKRVVEQEREKPRRHKVVFEVAPDPFDEALSEQWNKLPAEERLKISQRVSQQIVPRLLESLDAKGRIASQVGSYLEDTNPSFALYLDKGDPVEIAKYLGFVLNQDSMMVISPRPAPGLSKVGAVLVDVNTQDPALVDQVYQRLRGIRVNGEQPVGGQSTINNKMVVLNYSNLSTEDLAKAIDAELAGDYDVATTDVYSAFPEKQDYNYGDPETDPRGKKSDFRRAGRALRAEATQALAKELGLTTEARAEGRPEEVTPPKFSISGPRLTPELRQAAQGSAIVDADGNLIPMYHGTAVDITTFRGKQAGAIFVTPDPEFASGFAKNSRKWMVRHPEQFISKPEVRQAVQKLRQAVYAEYGKQSRVTKQFMEEIGEVLDDAKETGAYNFKGELGDKWFDITSEMLPDGENVMPLYVLAKRPFDYENKADVNKIVKQLASDPEVRKELGSKPKPEGAPENFMLARMLEKTKDEYEADVRDKYRDDIANGKWEVIETPEVQRAIKALNFDSFWVMEGVKNLAVYDPRLIKSATGNVGTFGQRPPTEKEAARAGMEPEEALRAQEEGDIRFSLRSGRWTDKRVESLISSNMYTQNGREGDTKGYAAFIRPSDFLDATATRDYREQLEAEREPLRREELAKQSQPIMLTIRKDRPDRYEITGHEGRHRMMALRDAGIEEVPVYLELYGGGHEKSAKPISVYLSPQSFGSQGKAIAGIRNVDMTPLSWEYRDEVKQKFGGEGEVKFSLRSQVDPAITARMLQTTTARDKKDYEQRITEAIGPESRSRFRAAALNRYNRLGEADKLKLARMGGADLYADANAESAALLSDLASGIVAGALGVYDKIGGVPVYNRYYVVEKQVMGPQGMQFIPIGGKITSRQAAEALARRQGGEVKERGYVAVTNKDNTIKGPLAIFAPLAKYGDPDIYRYYQFWAGVKRGEKWMTNAQGQVVKERLFEQPDVQKAEQLRQQFLKEGIDFEKIQKEWTAYNDELVQFMLDTGVLSQKQADEYRKHGDYLPFYRQIQGDDDAVGPRIFQPISAVKQPRKLKGGEDPLGDFLENMVRNTQSAVQAGMKNIAARRAADVGMDVGMVDKVPAGAKPDPINSFYVLENGEKVYYDTKDALFIESIKSLGLPEFPGIGLLSGPANVLRNLVTKDPGFMLANMMRDSLSAWTTSGVNMMPIAATLKNFTDAIAGQSPEFRALQMAGVIGGYDYSQGTREATEQFGKELRRTAGAQTAGEKAMRPFTYLWEGLEKGTQASDAATRIEVYKATLKETGNEAEALFRALEVMNFNRKGNNPIVRVATAAIPFLNARMQGLDVLYRAAFGKNATKNAAEIQKAFWVRGMTMAALSTMYWMLTHDEEEYKRQEQETRDNNWLFPSLGIRVPIPFEVGVLFKVVPERIAALTLGDDTAKDFTMSMGRNLANSLLANPIPQVALPLIESATNFSFFTLRPIVGQGLEGVAPAYQVGPGTSRLAEALGKATNLSPMKIDQILQGYTGTIGQYMSDLIDTVWDMHTDNPKASKRFEQLPVIKRFALDPDARGQVTAYFDLKNAADEATRTANLLERSMNYEEYGKYMTENIKMFAFKDYILDLDKTLKDYRDMKNMIRSLPMDADQKRDSIRAITQIENQMTTNIQLLKKQMQ